jgi:hypothetical protein
MKKKQEKSYLDTSLPLKERIELKKKAIKNLLNPFDKKNFNPDTFEPLASKAEKEVAYRKRIKPPKKLPTFGLNPKEIMEGQMIGMYESKQDIYLILAHRCNEMQDEIDLLRSELKKLKL